PAALSDDLGAAVDYGAVARRIVEIGTGQRVNLIERLAGLMVDALLREFPAHEVRVRVRKLTPPLHGLVGTPAVELVRRRCRRARCSSRCRRSRRRSDARGPRAPPRRSASPPGPSTSTSSSTAARW